MKLSTRARFLAFFGLLSTFMLAFTSIASASSAAFTPEDKNSCVDLGNGYLCLYISPVNQQGQIQVTYEKYGGNPFVGHVAWQNPSGSVFGSPDVAMSSHNIYSQMWPTWVGPGCNYGVLVNKSTGETFKTPRLCV
ncbi:hypothetical protein OG738_42075 [Amycolatopsis sp. NBC_01488]|uniref:hypothetical protein n=1 Tax=Amycolatopsis sp. NBC_01488 TaxID=2903563 RepID=UPI002E2B8CED|nr:hypothetical protein [Amycolatopsis sp. NBC_01488]